jgi:hypothetical protein
VKLGSRVRGRRLPEVRRLAAPLAGLAAVGAFWFGVVGVSGGRVLGAQRARGMAAVDNHPTVSGKGTVSFSAVVNPNGRATTAYFEFGLDPRYSEPRPRRVVYAERTPAVHLAADAATHLVSGSVAGLLPNALYHLRLVATSSAGTVRSGDTTFRTAKDPAPPPPVIGKTANVAPVSGLVFIELARTKSAQASATTGPANGPGFLPLTEPRQLPVGSSIDARAGAWQVMVASAHGRGRQRSTLTGALVSLSQTRSGRRKGLTTLDLLEGAFAGAPTYSSCRTPTVAKPYGPAPVTPALSSRVLQTLRARDRAGSFRILGRYSVATVGPGTVSDTVDRCDGTLTVVHRGTANVDDLERHTTIVVRAGQRYLATAP